MKLPRATREDSTQRQSALTRARIITAAGEIFAERGFRSATVREITGRAKVNVAAVNYYFRDKEELYHCVLREAKAYCGALIDDVGQGSARARLRSFILRFLHHLLDPARPGWHIGVVTQEMIHPTPAIDLLADEMIGPIFRKLCDLITEIVGRRLPDTELHLLAGSILGQCLFHRRSRPVIERLSPELCRGEGQIERIAVHIADFSLVALDGLQGLFNPQTVPVRKLRTPASSKK